MLVEVIPLHTSYRDAGFTYRVPDELVERVRIGSLVEVPISRRTDDGIVASMQKERDFPWSVRDIIAVFSDSPLCSAATIDAIRTVSSRYFIPIHRVLALFVPASIVSRTKKRGYAISDPSQSSELRPWGESLFFCESAEVMDTRLRAWIADENTITIFPNEALLDAIADSAGTLPETVWIVRDADLRRRRARVYTDIASKKFSSILTTRRGIFLPLDPFSRIRYIEDALAGYYTALRREYDFFEISRILAASHRLSLDIYSTAARIQTVYRALASGTFSTISHTD